MKEKQLFRLLMSIAQKQNDYHRYEQEENEEMESMRLTGAIEASNILGYDVKIIKDDDYFITGIEVWEIRV